MFSYHVIVMHVYLGDCPHQQ